MSTEKSFISPHDPSLNIPNTEGWEEMYPYHALVNSNDPKRRQHESETLEYGCHDKTDGRAV
jgi:hypothetical protein